MSQNEERARFQPIGESDDVMMQEADQSQGNAYFLDIQTDDERRIKRQRPKSEMERIMDAVDTFGFKREREGETGKSFGEAVCVREARGRDREIRESERKREEFWAMCVFSFSIKKMIKRERKGRREACEE
jgi:hypothetical protein